MSKLEKSPIDSRNAGLRNELLVLDILRRYASLSQSQLCRQAGISSSTASYIIARLREKNLIIEQVGKSSLRGAKPVTISINPSGKYVVGVEINPTDILVGLFDFNCGLIEKIRTAMTKDHSPENTADVLEITIRGLLGKGGVTENLLAGIGLTVSGSISKNEIVELSSPMGWKNVPLKAMLQDRFKCPVSLYTTRVRLLAESSLDPSLNEKDVLYIHVGNGVGGHAIIDGRLIRGSDNRCGEIGHIVLDPFGPVCGCGHSGCLEAYISGPALARKIQKEMDGRSSLKSMIVESDMPDEVIDKWGKALKDGDSFAGEVLKYAADKLATVAAMAINCYDPQIVMLGGYVCRQATGQFAKAIEERIGTDVFDNSARHIAIVPAKAGEQALILGSAWAVLKDSAGAD